ncbi:ABC transporter permease, partial [Rhizobiaceae bacterium LC148]
MVDVSIANIRPDRAAVASQWQLIWWAFKRHKLAMAALVVTVAMYVVALVPGFFAINDPTAQNARATFHPPQKIHFFDTSNGIEFGPHYYPMRLTRDPNTLAAIYIEDTSRKVPVTFFGRGYTYSVLGLFETDIHLVASADKARPLFLFGADRLGRDVYSRVVQGAQVSLSIGLVGVCLSLLLGIVLGGISGYYGGRIDFVMQRVIDFVLSLPTIPIWLALAAALPQGWPATLQYLMITIILSFTGWAQLARVVRGRFLSLRTEEFVAAARLDGVPESRIIFRHMLPSFS